MNGDKSQMSPVSDTHRKRFEEIRKSLRELGCKESGFVKIELLFFEVLTIAKVYGEDAHQNSLLAALKNLQNDQYEKTKVATRKASEREALIRRFTVGLRKILSVAN
jgi:hypothetical protein